MTQPINVVTTPPKPEDIQASYGLIALLKQSVPEVGGLVDQAVRENWTPDRFAMTLANSGWWKNTPQADRQWLVEKIADPASAERDLAAGAQSISNQAVVMGFLRPDDGQARQVWLDNKLWGRQGQDADAYIGQQLANNISADRPDVGGRFGQYVADIYKAAGDYGYSGNDLVDKANFWARLWLQAGGQVNESSWTNFLKNYAKQKYAPFADRIDKGETVRDIAAPYVEAVQNTLERPGSLQDKYVQKALQGYSDGKGGVAAPPVWEFEQKLRADPTWQFTNNSHQAAAGALAAVAKSFGMPS